jgi:hypothetical protein
MVLLKKNAKFMPSVEEVVFETKRMKQAAAKASKVAKAASSSSPSSCAGASGGGGADANVAEDIENDETDDEEDLFTILGRWRRGEPPDLHRRLPLRCVKLRRGERFSLLPH